MHCQSAISEIRNKLKGNKEEDYAYLVEECQKYKDHQEITREIGRMINGLLNDEQKMRSAALLIRKDWRYCVDNTGTIEGIIKSFLLHYSVDNNLSLLSDCYWQ
ncbi:MAG: hypothetical protein PUD22_04605 [Erysipelotrichaceae bacterium]|nr:hypothetical protein [Erysipelotrichaceae bacterium]